MRKLLAACMVVVLASSVLLGCASSSPAAQPVKAPEKAQPPESQKAEAPAPQKAEAPAAPKAAAPSAPKAEATAAPKAEAPAAQKAASAVAPQLSKTTTSIGNPGGVGGTVYAVLTTWSEPIKRAVGLAMTPVPTPGEVDSLVALQRGTVDFTTLASSSLLNGFHGEDIVAKAGLKPMKELRQVWLFAVSERAIGVRANSDIKTVYDLKGKTMGIAPDNSASFMTMMGIAGFLNEDYAKFRKANATSYAAALKLVQDRGADFAVSGVSGANVVEMAASPGGIRWLNMPFSDKAGWERFFKAVPRGSMVQNKIVGGAGPAVPAEGLEAMGASNVIVGTADTDPNLVYTLAKGITLGYPDFKDLHPVGRNSTLERSADFGLVSLDIPYHEGAIKWFKERGLWTAEHERNQQERLKAIGATK